jgi:hypothetical protein
VTVLTRCGRPGAPAHWSSQGWQWCQQETKGKKTMSAKKTNNAKSDETAKPPVAKIRVGLITGSIWERDSDKGTFYAVTFERRYRDSEGNFKSSHSYDTQDLLVLAKVADLAHSKILELQKGQDA